jgi:hypothetical protein
MSLVLPGTMLFAVFGAGSAGVAWVLFTPQAKRNDRRYAKRASREFSARTGRVGESVRLGPNFPAPLGPAPRPVNTHGKDRRGHLPHELREMWATAAQRPAAWAGSLPRRAPTLGCSRRLRSRTRAHSHACAVAVCFCRFVARLQPRGANGYHRDRVHVADVRPSRHHLPCLPRGTWFSRPSTLTSLTRLSSVPGGSSCTCTR